MRSYDCPQCGAAVPFQSAVTVFAVCGYCRSMVVRRDVNVELLGFQAELPPDLSPLQIGTKGEFEGRAFTLIGRVRIRYNEGSWNEWLASFGEDRWGWVAESQGFYMVSFEVAVPEEFPGLTELKASSTPDPASGIKLVNFGLSVGRQNLPVGRELTLEGVKYSVRDSKQTEVISSEGELTFAARPGRAAISADLGGPGNAFANAEYSDDGVRLFIGRYCRFEELKLTELRPIPGWTSQSFEPTRGQSAALSCPNCGAAVALRAAGLSMAAVCGSCGSLIDTADPKFQLIDIARRREMYEPIIPLGRRGTFSGIEFECIGFMRRRDQSGDAWFEYLLFNPFAGFRWLVTFRGHWSLVEQLLDQPDWASGDVTHSGETYRLFATGTAEVTYVMGEFYWKVRVRERTEVADFIHPPFVLSREAYPNLKEVTWSHGEYLHGAEVQAAFKMEEPVSEPRGAYLNQPNPHTESARSLRRWAPLFACLFVGIQLLSAYRSANQVVYQDTLNLRPGETNRLELGKAFAVKGGVQPLEVSVHAPVDNSWMELEVDLVNATNQQTRTFTLPLEYYHGWDDGSWSEGRQRNSTVLTAVDPGTYYVVAELAGADSSITEIPVEVTVTRDVIVWSNFWLGLIGLMAYPSYRWLREHTFERERWSMSDYSPYAGASDDDDDDSVGDIASDLGGDD
jgi:hypothetical protein